MARTQDVFAERLARLDQTHDQRVQAQAATAQAERGSRPDWVSNLGYPASILGACILGLITVVMSRYVMFHLNGVPDPNADPDMTMLIDGGLAFGIAFVLRSAFHLTTKEHLLAKTVGIWIALTCMHNLVHAYPTAWAYAFSPEWVAGTTDMTEPSSFFFRGMSFKIDGGTTVAPDGTETAKPEIKINRH